MMFAPKSHLHALEIFLAMILTSTGPLTLAASTLLNEPFNYTNGALVTVSGGLWVTHSGTTGQVEVLSGRADLSAPESEDVNTALAGQPYPATTNTVLYASFTVNFSSLPSPSGEYFAHFKDATTSNFRAKMFALRSGAGPGQFCIGIANASNAPAAVVATNLNLNTDYRIYIRYVISNATSMMWLNPDSEASPSVSASDAATARTVVAFALRQNTGIGVIALDDLRVGTSFADVYLPPVLLPPTVTQPPVNTTVLAGGIAVISVAATGSDPLSYQWRFNGDDLAGATSSTLTLNPVNSSQAGPYTVLVTNVAGSTNVGPAMLTVVEPSTNGTVTLVTYNVKGNFATNWTTDGPQLQAIGRELSYLNPDIISFNEIPYAKTYEMTNFINLYLPGYFMVTNSGVAADVIRSVIMSRYPITRSQAWLSNASLTNFGYAGTFTRDLFEAEITLPGATEPLHVFTTHLKSGPDPDSQDRRAAEANAVSNFFVTAFIPSNGYRPYVLTGDLNEDVAIPLGHSNQPIQHLTATATGLHLTTPLNPFTLAAFTHSIQGSNSLDARFDYILPAGVLASNIVASQVFRTDLFPPPLPPNLNSNDDFVASDHLPVVMVFNYPDPALHVTLTVSNSTALVQWPALVGRKFTVETSTNLTSWNIAASNVVAFAGLQTWTNPVAGGVQFYRVVRVP